MDFFSDYLSSLTNLEILSWRKGMIRAVPFWIAMFKHLEVLDLSENMLSVLPEGLLKCRQLKELNLRNSLTPLKELPLDEEGQFQLRYMNLSRTRIHGYRSVFKAIFSYKSLEELHLNDCGVNYPIPNGWETLKYLKVLDLSQNNFTILPTSITDLIALESLDLRRTKISRLPDDICKLRSLKQLYIGGNPYRRADFNLSSSFIRFGCFRNTTY